MKSKTCRACLKTKKITDFYTHPRMKDGYLNICKSCTKARVLKHREMNLDAIRAYDRARGRTEKRLKLNRERIPSPEAQVSINRATLNYIRNNPEKRKANNIVNNAVRCGVLVKPKNCQACHRGGRIHGHHVDYSKPLKVIWLCPKCHGKEHRRFN